MLASILFFSASAPAQQSGRSNSAALLSTDKRFNRDQPVIDDMLWWDGRAVIRCEDRFLELNVEKKIIQPFVLKDSYKPITLAGKGDGSGLALCRAGKGLKLFSSNKQVVREMLLPEAAKSDKGPYVVLGDKVSIFLAIGGSYYVGGERGWSKLAVDPPDKLKMLSISKYQKELLPAQHQILYKNQAYFGYDIGEFGGGLISLDLRGAKWVYLDQSLSRLPGSAHTITNLQADRAGNLWAVAGLAHLGIQEGALFNYDGSNWKSFAFVADDLADHKANWPFGPTDFNSIGFDQKNRLYLLTGSYGVVRFESGKWTRLTPDWPDYVYLSSLLIAPDGKGIIGTYDAGVLLWDFETQKIDRVVIDR